MNLRNFQPGGQAICLPPMMNHEDGERIRPVVSVVDDDPESLVEFFGTGHFLATRRSLRESQGRPL